MIRKRKLLNGTLTYSDQDVKIRKLGTDELYTDAFDIDGVNNVYEETDIPIEKIEDLPPDN